MIIKEGTILQITEGLNENLMFRDLSAIKETFISLKDIREEHKKDPQKFMLTERSFHYGKVKKYSIRIGSYGIYNQVKEMID